MSACQSRFGSLVLGVAFAIVVPSAVVTCGGRVIGDPSGVEGAELPNPFATTTSVGGSGPADFATGGQFVSTTATSIPSVFPTATATSYRSGWGAFSPVVFLGTYREPDWPALGLPVPSASYSATVTSPCAERTEMCNGRVTREQWAKSLLLACKSELGNCGDAAIGFDANETCASYVVVYGDASPIYARCVATLAYHTSCEDGSASSGVHGTSCPL
jgi:hypothetical protein